MDSENVNPYSANDRDSSGASRRDDRRLPHQFQEDEQLNWAIEQSMKESRDSGVTLVRRENVHDSAGLANAGNVCYLNTIIQTLFQHKQVRNIILNSDFKGEKDMNELQKLFLRMRYSTEPYQTPLQLMSELDFDSSHSHQDVNEFMHFLIEKLVKKVSAADEEDGSLLKAILFGKQISVLFSRTGKTLSSSQEEFFEVNILPGEDVYTSIEEFAFSKLPNFTGDDGRVVSSAERVISFEKLPKLLTLQINPTEYDAKEGRTKVRERQCAVPLELDLSSFMAGNEETRRSIYVEMDQDQQELDKMDVDIQTLKNYSDSNLPLSSILFKAAEFLSEQNDNDALVASKITLKYAEMIDDKIKDMYRKRAALEQNRGSRRTKKDLARRNEAVNGSYVLYSIIAYSGDATRGHYWAFIRRPSLKDDVGGLEWADFNDIKVDKVENVDEMLSEAARKAVTLFYIDKESLCHWRAKDPDELVIRSPALQKELWNITLNNLDNFVENHELSSILSFDFEGKEGQVLLARKYLTNYLTHVRKICGVVNRRDPTKDSLIEETEDMNLPLYYILHKLRRFEILRFSIAKEVNKHIDSHSERSYIRYEEILNSDVHSKIKLVIGVEERDSEILREYIDIVDKYKKVVSSLMDGLRFSLDGKHLEAFNVLAKTKRTNNELDLELRQRYDGVIEYFIVEELTSCFNSFRRRIKSALSYEMEYITRDLKKFQALTSIAFENTSENGQLVLNFFITLNELFMETFRRELDHDVINSALSCEPVVDIPETPVYRQPYSSLYSSYITREDTLEEVHRNTFRQIREKFDKNSSEIKFITPELTTTFKAEPVKLIQPLCDRIASCHVNLRPFFSLHRDQITSEKTKDNNELMK